MEAKLNYFTEAIAREVEIRKQRKKHQLANDLSAETATALETAENRANFQIEATRQKLKREMNKKTAAAITEARAAFAIKREALANQLISEAKKQLELLSHDYDPDLLRQIAQTLLIGVHIHANHSWD
ncbi:MAG: hypothetical protein FWE05_00305 [Defluviitaleaceae bacterium]|nr:hypothetical protein [Defluviitaleaceae bacterium]